MISFLMIQHARWKRTATGVNKVRAVVVVVVNREGFGGEGG